MRTVYIHACAVLAHNPQDDFAPIKQELEQTSGKKFRRINRFIVLALASVYRLPALAQMDHESSLYLGTHHGCASDSFGMLRQMYCEQLIPLPFTFINTSANMAGFYIGQSLGLAGESYTFSQPWGSFEKSFALAYRDIDSGRNRSALAGSCDEAVFPLEESRKSMGMGDDELVLEGGCWFHLSSEEAGAIATMRRLSLTVSLADIEAAFAGLELSGDTALLIDPTVKRGSIRLNHRVDEVWLEDDKERLIGSAGGKKLITLLQDSLYANVVYLCREGLSRYALWIIKKQ